jgi:hypothetical protein
MEHERLRLSQEEERLLDEIALHLRQDPDPFSGDERRKALFRLSAGAAGVTFGAPLLVMSISVSVLASFLGYLLMLIGMLAIVTTVVALEQRRRVGLGDWRLQLDRRRSGRSR